jgi:hypothetical protein
MNYLVTCHISGCENDGVAIPITTDADQFMCGPCSQIITDVVEA